MIDHLTPSYLSPYRTRRKSSLSNVQYGSLFNNRSTDIHHHHDSTTIPGPRSGPSPSSLSRSHSPPTAILRSSKICFRCQKLIEQNNLHIAEGIDSSSIHANNFFEPPQGSVDHGNDLYDDSYDDDSIVSSAYSTPITSPNSSFSSSSCSPSILLATHANTGKFQSISALSAATQQRRRSSQPLTTSFQESLLSGRTSGIPSKPISFVAKLCVSELDPETDRPIISNKEFPRNVIPFDAIYYNWANMQQQDINSTSNTINDSPYVGTIDLDKFFIEREISTLSNDEERTTKRSFPGFLIPENFLLQLLLINDQQNVSECLVLKFNLATEKLNNGEKTFIRKNLSMISAPPPMGEKHFVSTIQINVAKIKNRYVLFNNIKVIFHNKMLPIISTPTPTTGPVSGSSTSTISDTRPTKTCEILKGGKTKLYIDQYKKCEYCSMMDKKVLQLKRSVSASPAAMMSASASHFKKDYAIQNSNKRPSPDMSPSSPPAPPTSSSSAFKISKKLLFNNKSVDFDNSDKYSQVFDEGSDIEDQDDEDQEDIFQEQRRRVKRRESFMF